MNRRYRKSIALLVPGVRFLRSYSLSLFRADLQAGLTVAVFAVPQVMAYAMLAGLAPVNGLYTVIVASMVAAIWGSSPYVSTGPSNSAALLTAAAIAPFAGGGDPMKTVFVFGLLIGLIRLVLGLARAGTLVDFVSESAMLGFTVAVGVLIALGQLHHFLGVELVPNYWFVLKVANTLAQVGQANVGAILIASGTLALMTGLNRYSKRFPVALTAIVLATVCAELMENIYTVPRVRDIAVVHPGLPAFRVYTVSWEEIWTMLPIAFAAALIGLIEVVAIAQVFGTKHGRRVHENQEFIGQGMSQLVASFFQGIPCSGSFSRSALLEHTGVRTRFGNLFFGVCMAASLIFFARWFNFIPIAALAGLLLFIGFKLIDVRGVRRVWNTSRPDSVVMMITFLVAIFVHLEYGLFAGIIASLVIFLSRARKLRVYELVPGENAQFREIEYDGLGPHERSEIVALSVHGDLFFGLSQLLHRQLRQILGQQCPRYIILLMGRTHSIDYSCWNVLFSIGDELERSGGKLLVCEAKPEVAGMFGKGAMDRKLPASQIFPLDVGPYHALRKAAAFAYEGLGSNAYLSPAWKEHLSSEG